MRPDIDRDQPLAPLVFDPNIETVPPPRIRRTVDGLYDEENAAIYLTYKLCKASAVTLRRWRMQGIGPAYSCGPAGKSIWYRQADLDEFIFVTCAKEHYLP